MRINVYSQELTGDIDRVTKIGTDNEGKAAAFHAIRLYLHSAEELHHTPEDDDRSAVTIWLPRSLARRIDLAIALRAMAAWAEGSWPGGWPGWQDSPDTLAVKIGREKDDQERLRAGGVAATMAERWTRGELPAQAMAPTAEAREAEARWSAVEGADD